MKRENSGFSKEKKNELPAGISRREFLKYSGAAGGSLIMSLHGGVALANSKSRVAFLKTDCQGG
ncbi:MAG: twin-arginine translocation signal domain-containing protein [Candidatus Desulfaltia sp.]|nr:twin-arginine translocation signal domain-containing protein [Candidatus Desulfaltia sp.]